MAKRIATLLIADMLDAIRKVELYVNTMTQEEFLNDEKTRDAVTRNIEIIGEAANQLPDLFYTEHPEIAWRSIIGMRNRLIHEYFAVNIVVLWQTVINSLPLFKRDLSDLLAILDKRL